MHDFFLLAFLKSDEHVFAGGVAHADSAAGGLLKSGGIHLLAINQ